MKVIITILFLFTVTNFLLGQTLDEVLEKHYNAVGMEYLKDVQTIRYDGNYNNKFLEKISSNLPEKLIKPDFTIWIKNRIGYRLYVKSDPGEFTNGYFNGRYWQNQNGNLDRNWNPGVPDRRIIIQETDLQGFLYDWENKGYRLTRLDDVEIKNIRHYRLRLVNSEKDSLYYFINKRSNLISYISYGYDLSDGTPCENVEYHNYKKVKNVNIAFKRVYNTQMLDGSYGVKEMEIKKVQINPVFDKELFNANY